MYMVDAVPEMMEWLDIIRIGLENVVLNALPGDPGPLYGDEQGGLRWT
jgi:hypothetical protein